MALERIELETDLRRAIDQEQLVLHYQPIVILETGAITGVEALVRWQHPTARAAAAGAIHPARRGDGTDPAARYVGAACGVPPGRAVAPAARKTARRWRSPSTCRAGSCRVPCSSTTSGASLVETGLEPHALILELTESVLTDHTDTVLGTLRALKSGRGAARDRRFRHGVFVAQLSAAVPDRHPQDREAVRGRGDRGIERHERPRARAGRDHARCDPRRAHDRRGHRDAAAARAPPGVGLRPWSGLPLLASAAARGAGSNAVRRPARVIGCLGERPRAGLRVARTGRGHGSGL